MEKPIIAMTMGDPAGIGPELVVKVLSHPSSLEGCRPLVIGDLQIMQRAVRLVESPINFRKITSPEMAAFSWPQIDLLSPDDLSIVSVAEGKVDPEMGKAVASCLKMAAELATGGIVQGLVSAPLNKESFHLAGFHYRD